MVVANVAPFVPEVRDIPSELDYAQLCNILLEQGGFLQHIMDGVNGQVLRTNFDVVITVNTQPQSLSRNGRRHTMLWVASTVNCLIDNLVGFGAFQLYAGWNVMDLAENARIMIQAGPTFNALYRCTDFEASGAIV